MILSTVEKLKQRVNAPNVVNAALDARCAELLESATLFIESYLRTNFAQVTGVVDDFTLRRSDYRARTRTIKLELSNNLVSGTPELKTAASYYNMARDISTVADELDYVVDFVNGLVRLPEWQAVDQAVRVTYDKGLATAPDGTSGKDLAQNVPSWLEEAALTTAAYHYMLPSIENAEDLCDGLPCEAKQLLDPYKRNYQNAYQVEV